MKTHTTTASGLLRSLAIVPVLALLVISCGKEEVVEESMDVQNSKNVNVIDPNESKQFYIDNQNTSGYLSIDGNTHFYVIEEDEFLVYDSYGNKVDLEKLGYEIIEIEEVEVEIGEAQITEEDILNNEFVPQPAMSPLEFIEKNKSSLTYFMDDTKINYKQAVSIIKATGEGGVSMVQKRDGSKYVVIMMTDEKRRLLPPPPPPLSPLEFIEANKEDLFYYINDKKVDAATAIKTIKIIGQDKVEMSKDANGKQSIKIKMSSDDMKLLPPPPPPPVKMKDIKSLTDQPFDLSNVQALKPASEQLTNWSNKSEYALWVDGKSVDNSILDKFDFVHFNMSKVYQSARSKKFPQPYQVSLYTADGFQKAFRNE